MVSLEALCAMNLAAKAMILGVCCYPEEEDYDEHQHQTEQQTSLQLDGKINNDENDKNGDGDDKMEKGILLRDRSDESRNTKSSAKSGNPQTARNKVPSPPRGSLVSAYKDALQSRTEQQRQRQHRAELMRLQHQQANHHGHHHLTPPHALRLIQDTTSTQTANSTYNYNNNTTSTTSTTTTTSTTKSREDQWPLLQKPTPTKLPFGGFTNKFSFARQSTEKCDNRYKFEQGIPELFFYSSSSTTSTSTSSGSSTPPSTNSHHYQHQHQPSSSLYQPPPTTTSSSTANTTTKEQQQQQQQHLFVTDYKLRQRSSLLLKHIRTAGTAGSLDLSAAANSEYDHDWLDWNNHSVSVDDTNWQEWANHDPPTAWVHHDSSFDVSLAE